MAVAKSRGEFEKAAEGLPEIPLPDLAAEVICIEPVNAEYFRNPSSRQRCIIRFNGQLYVTTY